MAHVDKTSIICTGKKGPIVFVKLSDIPRLYVLYVLLLFNINVYIFIFEFAVKAWCSLIDFSRITVVFV